MGWGRLGEEEEGRERMRLLLLMRRDQSAVVLCFSSCRICKTGTCPPTRFVGEGPGHAFGHGESLRPTRLTRRSRAKGCVRVLRNRLSPPPRPHERAQREDQQAMITLRIVV